MSAFRKKLTKLRRNPRMFVYDLVATRNRDSRLLGWMTGALADAIVTLAREQTTIAPLREQLSARIKRYGGSEMSRAANLAFERLDGDRRWLLFVAMTLALEEHDHDAAIAFGDAHAGSVDVDAIHSLVIAARDGALYDLGLHFITELPEDDQLTQLESSLYRLKMEATYEQVMIEAIAAGEEAVIALTNELLATESPLPVYHFVYAHVVTDGYSVDRRFAALVTRYGEALLELAPRNWTAAQVSDAHLYQGSVSSALRVLESYAELDHELVAPRVARLRSLQALRERGFEYEPASPDEPYTGLPGHVLFVLHHSAPLHSNGYATRGHGLLMAINRHGWDVPAVTRMGYPNDLLRFAELEAPRQESVDGVEYLRIRGDGHDVLPLADYLRHYTDRLLRLVVKREPEILHAHSNAINGLVANRVARALGIPSVYEVRGLWHVTRASRQAGFAESEYYELLHQMEVTAAQEADAVICITEALADEMVRCGVDRDKISIVPNGVDVERFQPRPRDRELETELGLAGKRVIGYVGSVVDYEGLDDLLQAVKILVDRGRDDLAVLIVGDGAGLLGLRADAAALGLDDIVTFTGRVPHAEVERYYSLIDIAPFPRKSLPVTEMVSPLKPFEAMAMNKIVVASDVAALAEIIDDGVNGFLFAKDDPEALAGALERALSCDGLDARAWVTEHRSWPEMARRLEGVYRRVSRYASRPTLVDLAEIEVADPVTAIRDAYHQQLGDRDAQPLRPDDYARLSHILGVLDGGESILDVGIGPGQFLNIVTRAGLFSERHGVDIERHPSFLAIGKPFEVDYVSVESLPYSDGQFDVVTCLEVIEHLDDAIFERSIAELRRVCGRQLIITVPFRERVLAADHKRRFDVADIERLFPRADLTIMRKSGSQLGRPTYWALIEERS